MKRLFVLILLSTMLVAPVLAQCIDNGICEPEEKALGCSDCSFGNVCVNDGVCTSVEYAAGCADCSASHVAKCTNDNVCTAEERSLGNCADCQQKGISTGLLLLVGGIGLIGFLVVFVIVAIAIAFFAMNRFGNRRIRL